MLNETRPTILCVDDDPGVLGALYDTLMDNYNVKTAESCTEAFDIFDVHDVALVISDQIMPEMKGIEFLGIINKIKPVCKKILLTGFSDFNIIISAINSGSVDKYFDKPWNHNELIKSAEDMVKQYTIDNSIMEILKNAVVSDNKIVNKFFQNVNISTIIKPIEDALIAREKMVVAKQFEQNLEMATLGELASGIVHEIKNPLSFVYANLSNLDKFISDFVKLIDSLGRIDADSKTRKEIEKKKNGINYTYLKSRTIELIEESKLGAERIKNIVEEFGLLSRDGTNVKTKADVTELIESSLKIAINEHKNRIEIKRDYDKNLQWIECFASKLSQVFLNLFVNARQSIEKEGVISIKTRTEGENVVIKIKDSGGGIPDDVKDKIFDTFFTTKSAKEGTGLGLSISLKIIKQHNGDISLQSKLGEGTIFTIKIPICLQTENSKTQSQVVSGCV